LKKKVYFIIYNVFKFTSNEIWNIWYACWCQIKNCFIFSFQTISGWLIQTHI
jgi:hypothetical protein